MPRYQISDAQTGRTLVVEGDAPPSPQDAAELFAVASAAPRYVFHPGLLGGAVEDTNAAAELNPDQPLKLDAYQQAKLAGVSDPYANTTDFLAGIGKNPGGFLKSLPADALLLVGKGAAAALNYGAELWRADTGTPQTMEVTRDEQGREQMRQVDKPLPFAAGKPIWQPPGTALQPEGNDFEKLLAGFTTPEMLALFPFGASKAVQATFLAQTAPAAIESAFKLVDPRLSRDEKQSAATDLLLNGLMTYGLGKHLATAGVLKAEPAPARPSEPAPAFTSAPPDAAESPATITGSNGGKAPEMPAEVGATPTPAPPAAGAPSRAAGQPVNADVEIAQERRKLAAWEGMGRILDAFNAGKVDENFVRESLAKYEQIAGQTYKLPLPKSDWTENFDEYLAAKPANVPAVENQVPAPRVQSEPGQPPGALVESVPLTEAEAGERRSLERAMREAQAKGDGERYDRLKDRWDVLDAKINARVPVETSSGPASKPTENVPAATPPPTAPPGQSAEAERAWMFGRAAEELTDQELRSEWQRMGGVPKEFKAAKTREELLAGVRRQMDFAAQYGEAPGGFTPSPWAAAHAAPPLDKMQAGKKLALDNAAARSIGDKLQAGWTPEEKVVRDKAAEARVQKELDGIKGATPRYFELKKQLDAGITKTVFRLNHPDGRTFVELTPSEFDYATRRQSATATPEVKAGETPEQFPLFEQPKAKPADAQISQLRRLIGEIETKTGDDAQYSPHGAALVAKLHELESAKLAQHHAELSDAEALRRAVNQVRSQIRERVAQAAQQQRSEQMRADAVAEQQRQAANPTLRAGNVNTDADVSQARQARTAGGFSPTAAREQKKFLLDAADEAIAAAPEVADAALQKQFEASEHFQAQQAARKWMHDNPEPQEPYPSSMAGKTEEQITALREQWKQAVIAWHAKMETDLAPLVQKYSPKGYASSSAVDKIEFGAKDAFYETLPHVTIEVPGDGTFIIVNTKAALREFKERAQSFPTSAPRAKAPGKARVTPTAPAALGKLDKAGALAAAKPFASEDASREAVHQRVWSDGQRTVATNGRMLIAVDVGQGGTAKKPGVFDLNGKPIKNATNYPEWRQVVPDVARMLLAGKQWDTAKLFTVLKQAGEISSENFNHRTSLWRNPDGSFGVSAQHPELGEYAHNLLPGARVLGEWSGDYLLDAVNAARKLGSEKVDVRYTDELSPLVIESKGMRAVIMPMRMDARYPAGTETLRAKDLETAPKPGKGGGGIGDPMGAPVPPTPAPAAKPGVTMVMDARLPVTMDRTGPGSVSVPQIMQSMQEVLRVAGSQAGNIRMGRFGQKARGIWKPHQEIIRVNEADNIPTATHEIGHGLQQMVYGTALAKGLKFLSSPIRKELIGLGKALYGSRQPVAGYSGEGFAEFMRYWLTTDDAATVAPQMNKFFTDVFLPANPAVAKALGDARKLVDTYRMQGAVERANRQVVREPGAITRMVQALAKFVGYQAMFESGAPIEAVSKEAARKLGRPLAPSEDPFKIYSWKRGSAGATVERMAMDKMLDVWGNPTGPSLAEALAPVKGQRQEFLLYLFARRAIERWGQRKNPGITLEDAQHIKGLYDRPEFQIAAQKYYDWWDGVLKYVSDADPAMADVVQQIKAGSSDYAPLARMIDPQKTRRAAAVSGSNPFMRMRGSGLPVKDIFDETFMGAARLVNRANRAMVTNRIIQLSKLPGLGHIVEKIPRAKVAESVSIEKVRQQLENMGVDTSAVPVDELLQYFSLADRPKGSDPIVAHKNAAGETEWYHVDARLYDQLEGLQTFSLKQSFPGIPHLGTMLDMVLGAPARSFRLGTTGLRASFSLVTNPLRDFQTLLAQTSSNPAKVAAMYPAALAEAIRGGPYKEAFYDLGAHLGQPLGLDIGHTQRVSKELFHGRVLRVVRNPVDHLRELLSISESAPRIAELKAVADDIGWTPGTPLLPDQAVQLALAAKRVTVDFSAAGDISRILNQAIPFFNPALQGMRSFARAAQNNPQRLALLGAALFTAPTLALWWQNKDKDWYQSLPWRERYFYNHIDDGKNVWQIPRAFELGNVFQVLPEAIFDSWYRHDPRAVKEALGYIFDSTNPTDYPVLLKLAKEQWQNRIDFWDKPIVPRSEEGLPPAEQVGPYTSKLAVGISKAFPELSPRRVDAAIRSYFGGVGTDVMDLLGIGAQKRGREWESSDLPVFGTLFRRGGEFSAQNQKINDFWDAYLPAKAQVDAFNFRKAQAQISGDQMEIKEPTSNLTTAVDSAAEISKSIRLLMALAAHTSDAQARRELYQQAGETAASGVEILKIANEVE